ncbi:MAG: FAD-dependent oxidoreductase [Alphaproteobacteria bacterium]
MNGTRYVIIGNGVAGNQAAALLRERDPDGAITIVSRGTLLHYRRDLLNELFDDRTDWRDYLVQSPDFYSDKNIRVRRQSPVVKVDTEAGSITLANAEELGFDKLLVATGGDRFLPEDLADFVAQCHFFGSYEEATALRQALPDGGRVLILGGDMAAIRLARFLLAHGYTVALVPHERSFRPHLVAESHRAPFLAALENLGVEVLAPGLVDGIEPVAGDTGAKRVRFAGGAETEADVVLPSYGLIPAVDFMHGTGVEIERGILVGTTQRSAKDNVWAAGEACQLEPTAIGLHIFNRDLVLQMGEIAARDMIGDPMNLFEPGYAQELVLDAAGELESIFLN